MNHTRTELGPKFSEGARLLWVEMDKRDWSGFRLGNELGLASGQVVRYLYGDRVPVLELAMKIKDVLGIEPESFTHPPSTLFVPPAAREELAPTGTDNS